MEWLFFDLMKFSSHTQELLRMFPYCFECPFLIPPFLHDASASRRFLSYHIRAFIFTLEVSHDLAHANHSTPLPCQLKETERQPVEFSEQNFDLWLIHQAHVFANCQAD